MPFNLIKQKHIDIIKETFRKLKDDLGRTITVTLTGTNDLSNCPNCLLDPINNKSAGVYSPDSPYPSDFAGPTYFANVCPVCNGDGYTYPTGVSNYTVTVTSAVISDFSYAKRNKAYMDGLPGNFEKVEKEISLHLTSALLASGETSVTGGRTLFDVASYTTIDSDDYEIIHTSKTGLGELFTLRVYVSKIRNH